MAGTIGHKLMSGKPTKIDVDKDTQIDVRCQVFFLLVFRLLNSVCVTLAKLSFG